jgi:hypothetical protein
MSENDLSAGDKHPKMVQRIKPNDFNDNAGFHHHE